MELLFIGIPHLQYTARKLFNKLPEALRNTNLNLHKEIKNAFNLKELLKHQ